MAELSALSGPTILTIFTTFHSSLTVRKLFSKLVRVLRRSPFPRFDLCSEESPIRRLRLSSSTLRIQAKENVRLRRR